MKAKVVPVVPDPKVVTTWFPRARPVSDWIVAGQTVPGHEANGLAVPWRVLDEPGRPGLPPRWIVIGRRDYPDGRWFLEFAINGDWVVATSGGTYTRVAGAPYPVLTCIVCGGLRGDHGRDCPARGRNGR